MQPFFQQFLYDEKNPLLFNNGFFVYFFTAFCCLYYGFRNKINVRVWLFCFFSLYFFYKASGMFVFLVILSAIIDYYIANFIYQIPNKKSKKILLGFGVCFNLALLFYFKYTNFFIEFLNAFAKQEISPLNIILPVGISFYTFESISYMVDVYKGKTLPAKQFNHYLLFLSFFPKLVMGPIVRAADFLPQITKPYTVDNAAFSEGFYLILSGLFKKLIISDFLWLNFVSYVFDDPTKHSGLECLLATYGYAIVIYCDFSGYSSIAIGLAKWLGFTIPMNFSHPYASTNITQFWKRWHISLSTWLKDYLYIPLGGNRKGTFRKYANLIATMLLGGLWHGANFTFLVWGVLHGAALAIHKLWQQKSKYVLANTKSTWYYKFFAGFITFNFVCFTWVFFASKSLTEARILLKQMKFSFGAGGFATFWENYQNVVFMMLLAITIHFLPNDVRLRINNQLKKEGMLGYLFIFMAFVLVYGYFKSAQPIMPIYLQF
jgi:D-alanyl-lipoteichoic acid acyltransferase DltB (MBOAT superfamily)